MTLELPGQSGAWCHWAVFQGQRPSVAEQRAWRLERGRGWGGGGVEVIQPTYRT